MSWCTLFWRFVYVANTFNEIVVSITMSTKITSVQMQLFHYPMESLDMEKSSQGCYNKVHLGFCNSHYNKIREIQDRLLYPLSKTAPLYWTRSQLSSRCKFRVNARGLESIFKDFLCQQRVLYSLMCSLHTLLGHRPVQENRWAMASHM